MEVLKKFAYSSTTSSLAERCQLFQDMNALLASDAKNEIPDAAFKLLGKMTYHLFPVYIKKSSKESLIGLNARLIELNVENALRPLLSSLEAHSQICALNNPSRSLTNLSLYGLDLVNGILTSVCKFHPTFIHDHSEEMNKLAHVYANFVLGSCLNLKKKNFLLAFKKVQSKLRELPDLDKILEKGALNTVNANTMTNRLLFLGFLMRFYQESGKEDQFKSLKNATMTIYINNIIDVRSKTKRWVVKCSNYWLKYVSKEDFQEKLLVEVKRSMLRNPEIILEAVGCLLEDLAIDLSDFNDDLTKIIASQLLAKDETSQNEAASAFACLSIQCSSLDSVQATIKYLFNILHGGEGKQPLSSQKLVILNAIGNVSSNCCANIQEILVQLIQLYGDFLKIETHEATLVHALEQLNRWLKSLRLKNVSPDQITKLNSFFKTLLDNKSYSNLVRNTIIQNMVTIYSNSHMTSHILTFVSTFMITIEKAQASSVTANNQLVMESLSAALMLAILLASDISIDSKIPNFLNSITDPKKQIFTNEKFLLALNEQGLIDFCLLFEKLCEISVNKESIDLSKFYVGYIFVLLSPVFEVRNRAQETLKKLLKSNSSLLLTFFESIEPCLSQFSTQKSDPASEVNPQGTDLLKWPSNKALCECLLAICSTPNLTQAEFDNTLNGCLLPASLPQARTVEPNLFKKCMQKLIQANKSNLSESSSLANLIQSQLNSLIKISLQADVLTDKELNACETLCRLDPVKFFDNAILYALKLLDDNSRLRTVSKQEWEISKLKDGQIYDRSIVEAVIKQIQESSNQKANLKRENKAYSYKEQLAEIELRKELEAKKGGTNKFDPSSLSLDQIRSNMSKKQQEMLDAQITSEKNTREEVLQLEAITRKAVNILLRCIKARPQDVKLRLAVIMRTFSRLLRSPVAVGYVVSVLREIPRKMFSSNEQGHPIVTSFYDSIIYCTLRLFDAPIQLESAWKQESLEAAYKRIITGLKSECARDFDEFELDLAKAAFLHPFLKNAPNQPSMDENCLKDLIEIVSKFVAYRNTTQKELLIELKDVDFKLDVNSTDKLKQMVDNFLSSEYLALLISIIQLIDERKLNIQLQFQVAQACHQLFEFTADFLFVPEKLTSWLWHGKDDIQFEFLANYNREIKEICGALSNPVVIIRETALNCLKVIINQKIGLNLKIENKLELEENVFVLLTHRLVVACFEEQEVIRTLAKTIWTSGGFKTNEPLCFLVLEDLLHPAEHVRLAAAESLAEMLKDNHMNIFQSVFSSILDAYDKHNVLPEAQKDQFGRQTAETVIDEWESRTGLAYGLKHLAPILPNKEIITSLFEFFVQRSLNDRNHAVRGLMLEAAVVCLDQHGKNNINELLPLFEGFLQNTPKEAKYDAVRENVVILMGTLAKHLDKDDAKVAPIIGKLVQALQTPSQQVQEAVANCLPPLMPAIKAQVPTYVNQLLTLLLSAQSYGERRGAAYGLAGMLKGVGMLSLRQLNVLQRLNDAVNNKNDPKQREGALIGYEMLSIMFQKIFEPYSVEILPNLLLCFGDPDPNVRQAADDCAKAIMANLTFTGVKMILPKLLERLGEEESWRTKCGSVELLGNMAHCAPKQLSTCLPNIVPKLIEVLSDSHVKVQNAGTQALRHIGSVIKNPEIQMITNVLLEALQDPAVKTQRALQVLLETKFVHFIDAASLALIMPIVQRAFQDRSTEIRKMASQIMGNMYSLTDQKDLQPYLPSILPGIKLSLLDPVPEVRSVSSKALGTLISSIGENGLNEIIAWLMDKLVSEQSSVDRSGAAQGLSEVFGALGVTKLEKSMPEIIERTMQLDLSPFVRDGYIMMFIYLPLTFGDQFTPYVGQIIQPILKALADDCEFVRETAIRAGQRVVNLYADTAISLFLPELEKGLFDANWRIRFSSVQLLGDLLYKVSGVQGKMTTESAHEDDNFGTEKGSAAIVKVLGEERRNKIFSGLYMGRSDVSLQVRQASLHIWKVIVANTPKTLKEILPTLFNLLLGCLASTNADKRQIAATTLVDIVKKLGERILPDIIPILERGLDSDRAEQRQGVCIGLTEIMSSTSRDNIMSFSDSLVPTVRKALMDPLPDVRSSAARTFDNLHNMIGSKALEEVGLSLLEEMKKAPNSDTADRALDGLKQVMLVKSRVLLPFLIPHLTQPPVNVNALCKLCCCASTEVLSRHLSKVLHTLVQALALTLYNQDQEAQNAGWVNECELLLLSIEEAEGVKTIVNELLAIANNSNNKINSRLAALDMLTWFCSKTEADYSDYLDELTKSLLGMFSVKNDQLLEKAWTCFNAIIEQLKGASLIQRLPTVRQCMRLLTQFHLAQTNMFYCEHSKDQESDLFATTPLLPGFCLPKKGITCLLPIFKEGLLNGPPDIKEQSAQTLCECIKLSDRDSLKSSVMAITGPLIRVLGERYSWQIKSAILDAIYLLLLKVDMTLKPFLPQLQPTFLKNLNDTNRLVRLKSGYALARLLDMNPRLDQVVLDFINFVKQAQDNQVRETILNSIRLSLSSVGNKTSNETRLQLYVLLKQEQYLFNQEYSIRAVTAGALGALVPYLPEKEFDALVSDVLDFQKYSTKNWIYLQSNIMVIAAAAQYCPQRIFIAYELKFISFIKSCASSDRTPVEMSAVRAICFYLDFKIKVGQKADVGIATVLAKYINQPSNDAKLLSVQIVTYLGAVNKKIQMEDDLLKLFVPMLVNGTREKAPTVRLASEIALVELFKLKAGYSFYEEFLKVIETMKESFEDCIKSLSKEALNAHVNSEELNIDETLIKIE